MGLEGQSERETLIGITVEQEEQCAAVTILLVGLLNFMTLFVTFSNMH